MRLEENLKVIEGIKCPFCKGKNLELYIGFRHCKDCDRSFDYTDIIEQEAKKA